MLWLSFEEGCGPLTSTLSPGKRGPFVGSST